MCQKLVFEQNNVSLGNLGRTHFRVPLISAGALKRLKEVHFDNVIQKGKKFKVALKIKKILVSQQNKIMALRDLGRWKKALGRQKK